MIQKYIGTLKNEEPAFQNFIKNLKEDCKKNGISDAPKIAIDDRNQFTVHCYPEVADLIRKRKEIIYFRCDGFREEEDDKKKKAKKDD